MVYVLKRKNLIHRSFKGDRQLHNPKGHGQELIKLFMNIEPNGLRCHHLHEHVLGTKNSKIIYY